MANTNKPDHPHGGAPGQTGQHPQGGPPGQTKKELYPDNALPVPEDVQAQRDKAAETEQHKALASGEGQRQSGVNEEGKPIGTQVREQQERAVRENRPDNSLPGEREGRPAKPTQLPAEEEEEAKTKPAPKK